MNTNMLKFLVELSNGEIDVIDSNAFFNRFPQSSSTERDLRTLKNLGFISILDADNKISEIGVNKKAIDYIKNALS